jgi:putative copper resistance protein D
MSAVLAAARALHFGATLLVFGETALALFVARPAWRATKSAGVGWADIERRIRPVLAWALAISVLSGIVWLALEVPLMSGEPIEEAIAGPTLGIVVLDTWFGRVCIVRLALAALFAWLLVRRAWLSPWGLLVGGAYLAAPAFAGHAAGGQGVEGAFRIAIDMAHLVAAGAWVGALPGLVLVLRAARQAADAASLDAAARATRRFSALGAVAVAVIVASGVGNSVYMVGAWGEFTDTEYGRLLLAKLAVVAAMLSIAATNLLHLSPRVAKRDARSVSALARNAMLETLGGIAVVGIVGLLGITVPAEHAEHMEQMEHMDHRLHSDTSRAIIPNSPLHRHHG